MGRLVRRLLLPLLLALAVTVAACASAATRDWDRCDEWVQENRDDIEASLRTGDCLLLICGDEIHVRVATLAERFAKQANPLSRCTLALVSMNIYSDGTHHLLVPALVEAVTDIQRELTIRVAVVDGAGQTVGATSKIIQQDRITKVTSSVDEWLANRWSKFSPVDREACQEIIKTLEGAGIDGLRKDLLPNGKPFFVVDDTSWGRVKLLRACYSVPALRDSSESNGGMNLDTRGLALWKGFQQALLRVNGAVMKGSHVNLPVQELRSDQCRGLVTALSGFVAVLRQSAVPGQSTSP